METLGPERLPVRTSVVLSRMANSESLSNLSSAKNVIVGSVLPNMSDMTFTWLDDKVGRFDENMSRCHRYMFTFKSRVTLPNRRDVLRDIDEKAKFTRSDSMKNRNTNWQIQRFQSSKKKTALKLAPTFSDRIPVRRKGHSTGSPRAVDEDRVRRGRDDGGSCAMTNVTVEELFSIRENPQSMVQDVMKANATIEALFPNGRGLPQQYRYLHDAVQSSQSSQTQSGSAPVLDSNAMLQMLTTVVESHGRSVSDS